MAIILFYGSERLTMRMLKQTKPNEENSLMLNERVVNLLKAGLWDLATCADGEPNVVPVALRM